MIPLPFKTIKYFIYIKKSGQFNNEWYLSNNPDVAAKFDNSFWHKLDMSGIPLLSKLGKYMAHPLRHYIKYGCYENRRPTPFFSDSEYCAKYGDVDIKRINPFYHYLKFGIPAGRKLDSEEFLAEYAGENNEFPDVRPYFLQPGDREKLKRRQKVALHLHLYHDGNADEIISLLNNIPVEFDLFVSLSDQKCEALANTFKPSVANVKSLAVQSVPPRAGDLGAWLIAFGENVLKYDCWCHLHNQQVAHDPAEEKSRAYLRSHLLGSAEQITGILNLLGKDGKFVYPKPFRFTGDESNWGGLFQRACDFFAGKGVPVEEHSVVEYPQYSMFWCRSEAVKQLLQLNLQWSDFPAADGDGDENTLQQILERSLLIAAGEVSGYSYCLQDIKNPERSDFYEGTQYDFSREERKYAKVKVLSYYLPQFHPTPENDLWHGKGFTEWTSTNSANPLFSGHYQQHIPHSDIGFYLLESPDVLAQQAEMMKKSGVYGQIFYHYWFTGKLILETPAQMLLAHPEIDMPFCFCWANENWTKCWDGNEREILLEQRYSAEDAAAFINYLIPFFKDPRYIRVGNRPVLFIYRVNSFPDFETYKDVWDKICLEAGVEKPYLVATLTRGVTSPAPYKMDAAVERVLHDWTGGNVPDVKANLNNFEPMTGSVLDYGAVAKYYISKEEKLPTDFTLFRSIVPQWDNTARYHERALLLHKSTPELWGEWLDSVIAYSEKNLPQEKCFAVVNAWNEWAEGAHLEPDMYFGYAYLNTLGRVLCGRENSASYKDFITAANEKNIAFQITFAPEVCDKLNADPVLKHKMVATLERAMAFLSEKGAFACFSESFESELLAGRRCEAPDIKINVLELALFMENTLWEIFRTNALYPEAIINVSPLNTDKKVTVLSAAGAGEAKQSAKLLNTNLFWMVENEKNSPPEKIATVIRCCASNNLALLENAFLSLLAQKDCEVKIYLCLQDFDADGLAKLRAWTAQFPWQEGSAPEVLAFSSSDECRDMRTVMLHEGLKKVDNDRFVTFLDYDDIIFCDGYAALAERLRRSRKAVAFARVFQSRYSVADSVIKSRKRTFEYGYSYNDFFRNNFAPIHSFMIDKSQIDTGKISYHQQMKYMEDYYMMLQILTPDNGDYELLKKKHYIGDYLWFTDIKNTLAGNKSVGDWMKDEKYRKAQALIDELKNQLKLTLKSAGKREYKK